MWNNNSGGCLLVVAFGQWEDLRLIGQRLSSTIYLCRPTQLEEIEVIEPHQHGDELVIPHAFPVLFHIFLK